MNPTVSVAVKSSLSSMIISTITLLAWLTIVGLGIYVLVLSVRFLKLGIEALKIYIEKNR